MFNKMDLEAKIFLRLFHLHEVKEKEYTGLCSDIRAAYVFNNNDEFQEYFYSNGIPINRNDLIMECRLKKTRKGSMIALKGLCDYAIHEYRKKFLNENNSFTLK